MTIRMSPPANAAKGVNPITVNAPSSSQGNNGNSGRTYSCAVGSTIDVVDHDAFQLERNGWYNHGAVYPTTGRPTGVTKGSWIIDSTLNAVIIWDQTQWRNMLTGAVV